MGMTDEVKEKQEETENPESLSADQTNDPVALKKLLEDEQAKSAEYLDSWRRAAADFSNYKKRQEKDAGELTKFANSMLISRLLPVLDDFDRAFQTVPDNLRDLTWIDGINLISRKMRAILEAEGLKTIEAEGKAFDPNLHEAVIHEESESHDDGTVITELQKGYKLNDRVLRPTLVKVAKKKS
jgi:molecular chaperone GrpE